MRINVYETFGNLQDGACILRAIAQQMETGDMDNVDPDWEIMLESHEEDELPVERDEPDMPARM